jgi:hypothetical protein
VLALTAALSLATVLVAGTGSATELLEGEVVAGAVPVLQKGSGAVRPEQPQLDATERRHFGDDARSSHDGKRTNPED